MKTVDIFGTCFSRELFNQTNEYKVQTYLMQQSIYTTDSNPYLISLKEIKTKDNYPFKNRMVYYDFNKLSFNQLRENTSEYLIIDLADQVRKIIILDSFDNVKVICSSAMIENLKRLGISYYIEDTNTYSDEILFNYLKQFVETILSLYDRNKIILNKVQMQNEYYENNEKKYIYDNIFVYNRRERLAKIERMFLDLCSGCKVLYTKNDPILDINHKFGGPHPMHFEEIYYRYRMNLLNALICNENIREIENNYQKEYNESIEKIRAKTLKK